MKTVPYASVRDLEVYYEVHGNGPPLLLISGTGNDLRHTPAEMMPVNEHFTTVHYDQRGLGRTSRPTGPYSMADYGDDAAALLDAVGWDRAHVLGISFGGMVAQQVAARHPSRVDRLVLACTSSGGAGGSSADLLAASQLRPDKRLAHHLALLDQRNDPETGRLAPDLDALLERGAAQQAAAENDPEAARGARLQLEARAGHDTWDLLPEITTPTLVIGGRHDGLAPPENQEALARRLPNAELAWADGGHAFFLQDPSSWTRVIDFLRGRAG